MPVDKQAAETIRELTALYQVQTFRRTPLVLGAFARGLLKLGTKYFAGLATTIRYLRHCHSQRLRGNEASSDKDCWFNA